MAFAPPPAIILQEVCEEHVRIAREYLRYNAIKEARQELAMWLCYAKSVLTDPNTDRMFVYDKEKGHYQKAGENLLKAELSYVLQKDATNNLVNEVISKVKAYSYRDTEFLNSLTPNHLLPLENGVYNIQTKELSIHSPQWFFTYKHPVNYDPIATCPEINKFLSEVVDNENDRQILIDIAALCLYRERITRKFFILTGAGHNGKSKYLEIIKAILGKERCVSVTPQHLADNDFAASLLYDKHVNLGADIPGGKIDDASILKGVTGGDSITVQKKGKDHFDIEPYCELVYSSNEPPRFSEDTYALWDRIVTINFPYTFIDNPKEPNEKKADKDIQKKILHPTELSGFLNQLLERIPRLVETKKLSVVIDPAMIKKEYQTITNTPQAFLNECCEAVEYVPGNNFTKATGWISKAELYNVYSKWCDSKKLKVQSQNRFARLIKEVPGWSIEEGRESISGEYQEYNSRVESYRGLAVMAAMSPNSPILLSTFKSTEQNREKRATSATPLHFQWKDWLDSKNGGTATVDEFIAYLTEFCPGVSFDTLISNGDIYEPRSGYVRRVL